MTRRWSRPAGSPGSGSGATAATGPDRSGAATASAPPGTCSPTLWPTLSSCGRSSSRRDPVRLRPPGGDGALGRRGGRRFCAVVESAGPVLVGASIRTGEALFPLSLEVIDERERPRRYRVQGYVPTELPPRNDGTVPLSVRRPVVLHAEDGSSYSLSTGLDDAAPDLTADSSVLLTAGANGALILRDAASRFLIDTCTIRRDPYPRLVLQAATGWAGSTRRPERRPCR